MKKIILVIFIISINKLYSQHNVHNISFGATLGNNQLVENDESNSSLGYGLTFDYNYMFSENWGVGTGLNYSVYRHESTLNDYYTEVEGKVDDKGRDYIAQVTIDDWREYQNIYFIEIPVVGVYKTSLLQNKLSLYVNVGFKYQIPVVKKYKAQEGSIEVKGYYPQYNLVLEDMPNHGYYKSYDDLPNGKLDLSHSIALTTALGVLHPVSDFVSLYAGLNIDYGLNNIRSDQTQFVNSDNLGELNKVETSVMTSCNTMSVVLEFGCRIYL